MKRLGLVVLAAFVAGAGPSWAQAPSPSPSPASPEGILPPALVDPNSPARPIAARGSGPRTGRGSADAGALKGVRANSTVEGEAVIVLGGLTRTVRPGDVLGGDVIRSIQPGRIVLLRPATEKAGEADVIVDFDAAGESRVRVYSTKDSTAQSRPEVR